MMKENQFPFLWRHDRFLSKPYRSPKVKIKSYKGWIAKRYLSLELEIVTLVETELYLAYP